MTLTEFLLARLAEDEAAARDEVPRYTEWRLEVARETAGAALAYTPWLRLSLDDPARVLADVEAKRQIVADMGRLAGDTRPTSSLDEDGWILLCWETLERLAAIYSDHPDYDEAWRPVTMGANRLPR